MEKSEKLDIQKLNGIIKSILSIKKCFEQHAVFNSNNMKNDEIAQAACTQFITNIYEGKKKLRHETYSALVELNKVKLAGARNIASHDYDSVNFAVIYSICKQLIKASVLSELYGALAKLEADTGDGEDDGN